MTLHKQVHIKHGRQSAEVDEGLAGLILALWRRGYRTFSSCEAQPGREVTDGSGTVGPAAWIAFTTEQQARMVAEHIGGLVIRPNAEEIAAAESDDPGLKYPDHAGVAFPASVIEPVLAVVRGKALVTVGGEVKSRPKKLPQAPRAKREEVS